LREVVIVKFLLYGNYVSDVFAVSWSYNHFLHAFIKENFSLTNCQVSGPKPISNIWPFNLESADVAAGRNLKSAVYNRADLRLSGAFKVNPRFA
jgi:hypothetical protein